MEKELLNALRNTLGELQYSLHNQGALWIKSFDERQAIIDKNPIVKKAKEVITKAESL